MEFEIQEHLEAFVVEGAHHVRPAPGEQFLAHFHPHLGRVETVRHRQRLVRLRVIQGDNNGAGDGHGLISPSERGLMVPQRRQLGQRHCSNGVWNPQRRH